MLQIVCYNVLYSPSTNVQKSGSTINWSANIERFSFLTREIPHFLFSFRHSKKSRHLWFQMKAVYHFCERLAIFQCLSLAVSFVVNSSSESENSEISFAVKNYEGVMSPKVSVGISKRAKNVQHEK